MKDHLLKLLEKCIEGSSDTDLNALSYAIEGLYQSIMEKKQTSTYIDGLLHMETKIDGHSCEITVPLNPLLNNNLNMVHGGITATILDTTMGVFANHLVPEGFAAVTSQLNIHYLAPAVGEELRCRAEVLHQGKKTIVVSGEAFNSAGKRVAHATGSFFAIKKPGSQGE